MSAATLPALGAGKAAAGTGATRSPLRRRLYAGLGFLCVGVGAVGIVVPGLPTTVFLLAACWLFARSFPRFERALRENRVFGAYLRMASEGMPRRAKALTLASMWSAVGISLFWLLDGAAAGVKIAVVALAVGGTWAVAVRVPGSRRSAG